jgi:excisionase family DNA binding protein
MPGVMTIRELAEYLRINIRTVYRLVEKGEIPAAKIGRQWRFDKEIIDAWLRRLSEPYRPQEKTNILVVDDEEMIVELFRETLKTTGFSLLSTTSSVNALHMIEEAHIGLVFLDLRMPGIDGVELFRRIKASKPNLPVVIMTGYPNSDMMAQALAQGPFAIMNKPFSDKDIMEAVNSFLRTDNRVSERGAQRRPNNTSGSDKNHEVGTR